MSEIFENSDGVEAFDRHMGRIWLFGDIRKGK